MFICVYETLHLIMFVYVYVMLHLFMFVYVYVTLHLFMFFMFMLCLCYHGDSVTSASLPPLISFLLGKTIVKHSKS